MKKNIFSSVILIVFLIFTLIGCGGSANLAGNWFPEYDKYNYFRPTDHFEFSSNGTGVEVRKWYSDRKFTWKIKGAVLTIRDDADNEDLYSFRFKIENSELIIFESGSTSVFARFRKKITVN